MSTPAYKRLSTDARRAELIALGERLFAEHAYEELSLAQIAREGGVSKALLYHYFPSKRDFFLATFAQNADELASRLDLDAELPPAEALMAGLQAYLGWVEEHREAFPKLLRSAASIPEVDELMRGIRETTRERILTGLAETSGSTPPPAARTAVTGWLSFMDGAIVDWLDHDDIGRDQLLGLLAGTLLGALTAAGAGELLAGLQG